MIHPNMATMLCFLATDAEIESPFLKKALKQAVDSSLNMLSVDGDSSTNDTALIFANGAAEAGVITEGSPEGDLFQQALDQLCVYLTRELARDGEGANKLIEITVEGATTTSAARMAAKTVVSSSLVKSAVHGADPNWGRIIAALGRSGAEVEESKIALYVNDVCIMEDGRPISLPQRRGSGPDAEAGGLLPHQAQSGRGPGHGLGLQPQRRVRDLQQRLHHLAAAHSAHSD